MNITIHQALAKAETLVCVSDTPRLDVEVLLAHVLQCNKTHLYTWPEKLLQPSELEVYEQLLDRRVKGEPVAYLLGYKEFWSLELQVNRSTLIPRPETELLVEKALSLIPIAEPYQVIDLGTGTGAIALAIASERPVSQVIGCDMEQKAVALAGLNQEALAIRNVSFIQSDWCSSLTDAVDIIVSNPPYIDVEDPHLKQGDVRFEPRSALVAEDNGLADIKIISAQVLGILKQNGWLLLEHGFEQGSAVRSILQAAGYQSIETDCDLANLERITYGQKRSE